MDEISKRFSINAEMIQLNREIERIENATNEVKITISCNVTVSFDELQELKKYKQNKVECLKRQLERLG